MSNTLVFPYAGKTTETLTFLNMLCDEAIIEGDIFIHSTFQDKSNQFFSEEFISNYLVVCTSHVLENLSLEYKNALCSFFPNNDQLEKYLIKKFNRHIKLKVVTK